MNWRRKRDTGLEIPGAQTALWNFSFFSLLLYALIFLFLLLSLGSIFKDNSFLNQFSIQDLKVSDSVAILISLVGLLIVKIHFSRSIQPYVTYICRQDKMSSFNLSTNGNDNYFQVILENVGGGLLIVDKIKYHYRLATRNIVSTYDVREVLDDFREVELLPSKDFEFLFLFKGAAVSTRNERCLFEINVKHLHLINFMDATLTFKNLIGDRYQKKIFFIPRKGIDPKTTVQIERLHNRG